MGIKRTGIYIRVKQNPISRYSFAVEQYNYPQNIVDSIRLETPSGKSPLGTSLFSIWYRGWYFICWVIAVAAIQVGMGQALYLDIVWQYVLLYIAYLAIFMADVAALVFFIKIFAMKRRNAAKISYS